VPIPKKKKPQAGFTLIEILISLSILSVIGLVIFSAFNNSIKIWQRLNGVVPEEDIAIFFAKITLDLENSFNIGDIEPEWGRDRIGFATLVRSVDGKDIREGIGRVEYFFDEASRQLYKRQYTYSGIYQDKVDFTRNILGGIRSADFKYYSLNKETGKYEWSDSTKTKTPLAVKINIDSGNGFISDSWEKLIAIPAGES